MRNIFSPIFLLSLSMLYICHHLNPGSATVQFITISTFLAAVGCCILKKFKWSYVFIALSIGLLITSQFLKEKETFYYITQAPSGIPAKEYITIHGELTAFPEIGPEHSILYLETNNLEYQRKKIFKRFSLRIKVKGNLQHLSRGDYIVIDARVYNNRFNRNFFPNSMEDYVLSNKTHFNGYCKSARLVSVEKETSFAWKIIGKWRNEIREVIEKKYADEEGILDQKGVFLQAILLGERGKLGNPEKEHLLNAGVYHLLAISGAHIGIIALFSLLFLKFLKVSYRKRYIFTALLLVLFLILSGFRVSAERAVLMAILIFTARILYLDIDIFNVISFAGLLLLMRNPAEFLDAGFILTFALTAAIVMGRKIFLTKVFGGPGTPRLGEPISNAPCVVECKKQIPPILSHIGPPCQGEKGSWPPEVSRGKSYIFELLSANFSAALIALPLSLFFFKRYSFAGFFAGLVLLPLTALITAGGILLIPLAPLSGGISNLLLTVLNIPLNFFFYIVEFFSGAAGFFTIFRASPSILLVILVFISFYLLSISRIRGYKIILSLVIVAGIVYMSVNIFYYQPGNLEVFYLDVGQGDSEVVVFPGGDALLVDGGGNYYSDFPVGQRIVLPFLLQKRIRVRWAAVSHFHPDHVRGVAEILHIIKPEELWISSEVEGDLFYEQLIRAVPGSIKIEKLHAPFTKKIGQCTIEFLYPERWIKAYRAHNNHSQVFKISDRHHSFLFTGDIEDEVEDRLVEADCSKLRAAVLKVPHHGSRTSSTLDFLKCIKPELAIFSYSQGNRFNFPHKEVVGNYKTLGIPYLTTARSGGIRVVSLPGSIEIEVSQ